MADSFFIKRGDKVQGPATREQIENLRSKLKASDLIATTGAGPWNTWDKVEKKLFPVLIEASDIEAVEGEPNPAFEVMKGTSPAYWQPQQTKQAPKPKTKTKKNSNKPLIIGLAIGGICLVFAFGVSLLILSSSKTATTGVNNAENEPTNGEKLEDLKIDATKFENVYSRLVRFDGVNSSIDPAELQIIGAKASNDAENALWVLAGQIGLIEQMLVVVKNSQDHLQSIERARLRQIENSNTFIRVAKPQIAQVENNIKSMLVDTTDLMRTLEKAKKELAEYQSALETAEQSAEILTFALSRNAGVLKTEWKSLVPQLNSYGFFELHVEGYTFIETSAYQDLQQIRNALVKTFGEVTFGKQPQKAKAIVEWAKQIDTSKSTNYLTPEFLDALDITVALKTSKPIDWVFEPKPKTTTSTPILPASASPSNLPKTQPPTKKEHVFAPIYRELKNPWAPRLKEIELSVLSPWRVKEQGFLSKEKLNKLELRLTNEDEKKTILVVKDIEKLDAEIAVLWRASKAMYHFTKQRINTGSKKGQALRNEINEKFSPNELEKVGCSRYLLIPKKQPSAQDYFHLADVQDDHDNVIQYHMYAGVPFGDKEWKDIDEEKFSIGRADWEIYQQLKAASKFVELPIKNNKFFVFVDTNSSEVQSFLKRRDDLIDKLGKLIEEASTKQDQATTLQP